jgi:glutathione peroxidase-family protein
MIYNYKKYQFNSLRLGFITDNKLYNRTSIFFTCASQSADIDRIKIYNQLYETGFYNLIALPLNIDGKEPGDNYDIYQYYENVLNIRFPVCEKVDTTHVFFQDFSIPTKNFTNYIFDSKLKFIKKTDNIEEITHV